MLDNIMVRATANLTGAINGTNTVFVLDKDPADLFLFKNGLLQTPGTDFNIVGRTITFMSQSVPQGGDLILARVSQPITLNREIP